MSIGIAEYVDVDESLRQTQRQLQETEARLLAVLESTSDCIYELTTDWRFAFLNRHAVAQLADGRNLLDQVIWDEFPEAVSTPFWQACYRCMMQRCPAEAEYHHERLGRTFTTRGVPGEDGGITVFLRDITEDRTTAVRLARAEGVLRTIGDAIPDLLYAKDRQGRMLYANAATLAMIGRSKAEVVGHTDLEWLADPIQAATTMVNDERVMRRDETETLEELVHDVRLGETRIWQSIKTPLRDPGTGEVAGIIGVSRDVTEARRSEQALAKSEAQFRTTFDQAAVGVAHVDLDGRWLRVNRRLCEMLGYSEVDLLERCFQQLTFPEDLEADQHNAQRLLSGDLATYAREKRYIRLDGSVIWANLTVSLLRDQTGAPLHFIAVTEDISSRKAAEATLRAFYEVSPLLMGTVALQPDGDLLHLFDNPATNRFFGAPPAGVHGRGARALGVREATIATWRARYEEAGACGAAVSFEHSEADAARSMRRLAVTVAPLSAAGPDGQPVFCYVAEDITERRAAEAALAESEARLRLFVDHAPAAIAMFDNNMHYLAVSRRYIEDYDMDMTAGPQALVGRSYYELFPDIPERWREATRGVLAGGSIPANDDSFVRADGRTEWVRWEMTPWERADGSIGGVILFSEVVTARKQAEGKLATSEARLRAAVDAVSGIVWTTDASGRMAGEQPGWAALTGQAYGEYQAYGWSRAVHPDDRQPTFSAWRQAVAGHETFVFEHRVRRQDGAWRRFAIRAAPLAQINGTTRQWVGVHTDVTEQRAAEAELARDRAELERLVQARTEDLQQTQSRLAQAEKMTALGQLAGGIAHDFNNVMQAVQGGAGLIRRRPNDPAAIDRYAAIIEDAAHRGTSVTRRLLSFARRGELRATAVDVAAMLDGLREVLAHTLGVGVVVGLDVTPGLPPVLADRGQLETAVVNLSTNARDAMPSGGTITLSAAPEVVSTEKHPEGLAPGHYVRLMVTDTGAGMDAATLARVMEPFFSTKPRGQGTGLGLPMARGFAEQSGGALALNSAPGRGTSVTLWLPVAAAGTAAIDSPPPQDRAAPDGSGVPRVLVVDDEDLVREVLAVQLADRGYDVIQATGAGKALDLLDAGEPVDLLVSDLAMPGMDGIALIRAAQTRRARLPAILLTGYAGEAASLAIGGAVNGSFSLLRKPITGAQLADRVATLLEATMERKA